MNKPQRDVSIDLARSLAIVLMVSANMAIIAHGQPWWLFRFSSSLAAPLFVSLANMMVVLGFLRGKHFSSFIIRGLFIFAIATLLDLSNLTMPLVNVDILYFIGLSLIIGSLLVRFSVAALCFINLIILALTPWLQHHYGYQTTMFYHLDTNNIHQFLSHIMTDAPHRYFIDGWFPLFPWLSIGFFGLILGKLRYGDRSAITSFSSPGHIFTALGMILAGSLLWWYYPGEQFVVYNYIELFYPPVPGFMILAMGLVYACIALMDTLGDVSLLAFLHPLGEASLFMYLFHIEVIAHILEPQGSIVFGMRYFIDYLMLLGVMIAISHALRRIRKLAFYKKMPHAVKWIFG